MRLERLLGYSTHEHAGEVPLSIWRQRGIRALILDKDNTLSDFHGTTTLPYVIQGLKEQGIALFPNIAVVSNGEDSKAVSEFGKRLEGELGVSVLAVCVGDGFRRKPNPDMGNAVAACLGVTPDEIGVIGDRRLVDVTFGHRLGAGAIALCNKQGESDAFGVPIVRVIEGSIVRHETVRAERELIAA